MTSDWWLIFFLKYRERIVESIDNNYRVITRIFNKYGNLPLCLENYALLSLPPIFTKHLYTYILSNILFLGEPSGDIISNYHGTLINIFMYAYYPIYQKKHFKPLFPYSCKIICLIGRHFFNSSPKFLNLDTLYDTVSKEISKKTNNFLLVF